MASLGLPTAALATSIVQNSSFETPNTFGSFTTVDPPNWVSSGFSADGVDTASGAGLSNANGNQYFYGDGGANGGILSQDLGVGFQPNTTYTVDLSAAYRNDGGFGGADINFGLSSSLGAPLIGAQVGHLSDQDVYTATSPSQNSFVAASVAGASSHIFSFTTTGVAPTGDIVAYFAGAGNPSQNGRLQVDNFQLTVTTAVPEPTSLLLFALGAAGLFFARRHSGL